ncbi:hypothetical protein T01_1463 [Trichinella spiralis]|uniref:Uncharacterized protein n=1 Tax=Trichinella spiralis TaxID=6334 RepID=A0A0V1BGV7_TRISP|nr:hypothetical protein T01_1463 [Trichinella spiralis]
MELPKKLKCNCITGQFIFKKQLRINGTHFRLHAKASGFCRRRASDANDPMRSTFNDCALKRASFLLVDFNLRETSFAVSDIGYK